MFPKLVMSVRTAGRRDELHEAGRIFWTTSTGSRSVTEFSMRADLSAGIQVSENPVVLEQGDLTRGKAVRFESALPLDWNTLSLSPAQGAFRVFDMTTGDGSASCRVSCDLPSDEPRADGMLFVTAGGLPGSDLAGRTLSLPVPLTAKQAVRLGASPRCAMVQLQADGTGTTSILLFGTAVAAAKPVLVERIACDAGTAAWMEQRLSDDRALVNVSLLDCPTADEFHKQLRLTLTSGDSIVIPYVLFQSTVTKGREES